MQVVLAVAPGPQEGAALGGGQPFMAVAGVPVGIERREVEFHLAGAVRAVHQHRHAGGMAGGDDAGERQHQGA